MRQYRSLGWIALVMTMFVTGAAPAADPAEARKKLEPYIGSWRGKVNNNDQVVDSENTWILGRTHVQQKIEVNDGSEFKIIRGYDEHENVYRASFFHSGGGSFHVTGDWKGTTLVMTGKLNGENIEVTSTFPAPNREEWTVTIRDVVGDPTIQLSGFNEKKN